MATASTSSFNSIVYPEYQRDLLVAEQGVRNVFSQLGKARHMSSHKKHLDERFDHLQEVFRIALRIRHPDSDIRNRVFQILNVKQHINVSSKFNLECLQLPESRYAEAIDEHLPRVGEHEMTELVALKTLAKIRFEEKRK